MNTLSNPTATDDATTPPAPAAGRTILRLLGRLRIGTLDVHLPDGTMAHFAGNPGPRAAISLANWNACSAALKSGDIGFAETWIAGDWSTPDLVSLMELFIANRDAIESAVYGTWWGRAIHRVRHLLHRNSRRGSRQNIHAHYDLGNDFYRLWLDPTLHYSSAWFEGAAERDGDLVQAQWAKTRRTLRECNVARGDRVLEIGCGWGALAETATRDFGASVTGVTLSSEQLDWARKRMAAAGLDADLRLQDYRDIDDAPFDAVVSIEMFEAVGRPYWAEYFRAVHRSLKTGGRACIQTITIRDDLFDRYLRSTDFIQRYIFPGGLLPSRAAFVEAAADAGFDIVGELDFGLDYAETLRRWRHAFLTSDAQVRAIGFDTRFMRVWEFYLAYCEAAFMTGNTSVRQFTLAKR